MNSLRGTLMLGLVGLFGCEAQRLPTTKTTTQPIVANDGSYNVTAVETLNQYAVLTQAASAGGTTLTVGDLAQLDSALWGPLTTGDLLLVIQMQGASVNATDTTLFGEVSALNSAGLYEFIEVASVNRAANTITVGNGCGGLKNAYGATGAQVVRVPQLSALTVSSTGTVTALPWDGARGGIVALHVRDTLSLQGTIDVSGLGFRGGVADNSSSAAGVDQPTYRSSSAAAGAEKGEGIAGFQAAYDLLGGRYGRGAAANAGGGGNSLRAGGGGGANANNGNTWNGQGVMDGTVIGATAWSLDPGRSLATSTANLANNSGGGRGGYSFSQVNLNATVSAPGAAGWTGNLRRERGGLGGRPLDPSALSRLYFGGGGGAGDGDQAASGSGGPGGGLVYVIADTVSGAGALVANGAAGGNTVGTHRDGAGGGGAGGTVIVRANTTTGFSISANGGNGGRQLIDPGLDEATGPGGGGSGGFIAITPNTGALTRSAVGGQGGDTRSNGLTEFPSNGATRGAAGVANAGIAVVSGTTVQDIALCLEPANLSVTLTDGVTNAVPGTSVTYTLTVRNAGPGAATRARVTDALPATLTGATYTCAPSAGATCTGGSGSIDQLVTIPAGGTATFSITATISSTATGTLTNTAVVYSPTVINDPDLSNNVAIDADSLVPTADLSVGLTATPSPVDEDTNLTWTTTVTNNGPSQAQGVSVQFTLPTDVTFVSAGGSGWACARALLVVTCTRATLAASASAPFTVVANVTLAGGMISASANVSSTSTDLTAGNNLASLTTTVNPVNDPPVNTVPPPQTTLEDAPLVFSLATSNAISIADVDVGTNALTITLTATNGTLTLGGTTGLTFAVGDGTADAMISASGTLGAINAALNGLTFIPTPNAYGAASVQVVTTDNGFTGNGGPQIDNDTVAITITPVNDPPTLANDTFTVAEDSTSMLDVLANDSSAPDGPETLTIVSVTPAQHGTVSGGGTSLTYQPNPNYFGPDSFTYSVSDGNGGLATARATITITPVNDPPTANADTFSVVEGSTNNPLPVLANDTWLPDAMETLTVTAVTPPAHGTASIDPNGAQLRYTPTPGYNGSDALTYTLTDPSGATATAAVTITIGPANDPPVNGVPGAQSLDEDTSFTFQAATSTSLTVSDPDAANAPVQVTLSATNGTLTLGRTTNLTFSLGDGTADPAMSFTGTLPDLNAALEGTTFTPTANFNGQARVELLTNDLGNTGVGGAMSDDDQLTLTVRPVNDPPTAAPDALTIAEDTADVKIDVLANDTIAPDVGETLHVTAVSTPAHGTTRLDVGATAVRYTPAANYFGTDTFTYTESDGNGGTATGTVTVTVLNVNDPPTAVPDVLSVAQDSTDNVLDVLGNDSIAPDVGETLQIIVVSAAQHGVVTLANAGTALTFTPTRGYIGPDTLTYTVTDGNGGYAATIVSLTIGADTDADGLSDADELALHTNPNKADTDDDGITDGVEVRVGKTDPLDDDSDDDGLLDGTEDANHNGILEATDSNPLTPDTDGDGLLDGQERGLAMPQGTKTKLTVFRADVDPSTTTNPLLADTDTGGVPDGTEDTNHNGRLDPDETNPNDPRDDKIDSDRDGLSDPKELAIGLDPNDADSDDDGVIDGTDGLLDTDGDGVIDALDPDSDNDGLTDGLESGLTDALKPADTDVSKGHFTADLDPSAVTDPKRTDSDGDGLDDATEDFNRNGRDDDGETDASKADTDDDGLPDGLELKAKNQTNPEQADSDGDGLPDGTEDANHNGVFEREAGETNPNAADTDHGGANDGAEAKRGTNPLSPDDDFDVRGGGGCAATTGLWVLASVVVLLARRRRVNAVVALLVVAPLTAHAQTAVSTAIDVQRYKPGMGSLDFLNVESANVSEHLRGYVHANLGYAYSPLVMGVPGSTEAAFRLVNDLTFFDFAVGLAIKGHGEVALAIPFSIAHGQTNLAIDPAIGQNALGTAQGDLRAMGKYAFFPRLNPIQLAASLTFVAPTGNTSTLRGGGAFAFQPRVDFEVNLSVLRLMANLGVNLRTTTQRLLNLTVGHELAWAVGAEVPVWKSSGNNRLSLVMTTTGALGLTALNASTVPMDALGGLRLAIEDTIAIEVAVGGGLTRGWATPRFEAVAGVSFTPPAFKLGTRRLSEQEYAEERAEAEKRKRDAEEQAEIFAPKPTPVATPELPTPRYDAPPPGFADADQDGVADANDKCPGQKETINGVKDDDGCPDVGEGLVSIAGNTLKLKTRITFQRNKATFTAGGEELLKQLALTLRAKRSLRLRVEVYVTELPTRAGNETLSGERANAIRDFLLGRSVNDAQLEVRGMGVLRPLDPSVVDVSPMP